MTKTIAVMMCLATFVCGSIVGSVLHASPRHLGLRTLPGVSGAESSDTPPLTAQQQAIVDSEVPKTIQALLDGADTIEVVAIEPCFESLNGPPYVPHRGKLLGCTILRTVSARDTATKRRIRDSLYYGIALPGDQSRCWEPHHGLRVHKGSSVLEIAICFTCGSCKGLSGSLEFSAPISNAPEGLFEKLLAGAREP